MSYQTDVRGHKRGHPTKPQKKVDVRKHTRAIHGSKRSRDGAPTKVPTAKAAAIKETEICPECDGQGYAGPMWDQTICPVCGGDGVR